jgi:hypothetical protein
MVYSGLSKKEVLEIYDFVMKKRKEEFGQRRIFNMVKEKFNKEINESTIANWIFLNRIPFGSEKTWFKAKEMPKRRTLYDLYTEQKLSSEKISEVYNVSCATVIKWLNSYNIKARSHLESMNTSIIKEELRKKKLKIPTKEFYLLSPEKAYILGVLCGDGHIHKGMVRLEIRKDEEFIREFANCLKKVYGLEFRYKYYGKRDSFVLYASPESVCDDLLRYGKFGVYKWEVPKEILNCSKEEIICGFLKGIFDSEGSAGKYLVSMTSINKKGVEDVSLLLEKIGVQNTVGFIKRGYHIIYITGKERIKRFRDKVGFTIKRKQKRLLEV